MVAMRTSSGARLTPTCSNSSLSRQDLPEPPDSVLGPYTHARRPHPAANPRNHRALPRPASPRAQLRREEDEVQELLRRLGADSGKGGTDGGPANAANSPTASRAHHQVMRQRHAQERESLVQLQARESLELVRESASMDDGEARRRSEEMRQWHAQERSRLDDTHKREHAGHDQQQAAVTTHGGHNGNAQQREKVVEFKAGAMGP